MAILLLTHKRLKQLKTAPKTNFINHKNSCTNSFNLL